MAAMYLGIPFKNTLFRVYASITTHGKCVILFSKHNIKDESDNKAENGEREDANNIKESTYMTKNEEPLDANGNKDPNKNANHKGDEPNVKLNAKLDPNDKKKEHCLHVRPFSDFRIEWLESCNFHLRILEMLPLQSNGSKMGVSLNEAH
ncbi:hypothetical protein SELMODRAFT_402523 [Selaginella moellendorffii]|uniref:Uncharacterized protein n=1 Tax=Selaginella moellendorffii TaxID=88036 RepID=D8QQY0_SELML|nr:hypothetical protein SELMODRAFT_402523 [Selaginella moellendorffii]